MGDLRAALAERLLVLDGAMGTMIQRLDLGPADFGGAHLEGCNENLVLTRPDAVAGIHRAYLEAGADIVETNTFGATPLVLAEYGLAEKAREINRVAAALAVTEARAASTPGRPRFVAGSIGPTTKTLSVTGGTTFDVLRAAYRVQAEGLLEGGVDALLVETSQDTLNVKAACLGIRDAERTTGRAVPLMLSLTIEPMGTMLAGQGVDAAWTALRHFRPLSVGLNCATGPEFMTDHLRTLAAISDCAVTVYPNAGLPDEDGRYEETPDSFAAKLARFLDEGWVNLVGGCCGTTPAHVARLAALARGRAPRKVPSLRRRAVSGIDDLEVTGSADQRPVLVGERTNVIGSRKFKGLVVAGKWEEASEIGRAQVKKGAQVVDVCLADPDRDERADMETFLPQLVKKVKAPVMIDSTDAAVIGAALKHVQGKALVNSVNLEDGEERFEAVVPLARDFGAALVVGCIDEEGMAVTRERKLAVATRSYALLTDKYGVDPEDIVFDPLVFPCASGDANYAGSAVETIEGVRLISERFPRATTILGISNVSFGLPPAGREVLNSVFLHACVQAGLTYAIVNSEGLERYGSIPEEDRRLAEDLLHGRGADPVAAFAARWRDATKKAKAPAADLPLDERLARCIVEGTKEGLFADLDLKLEEAAPLDIINGPLMSGMAEVGRLFNANELIVAEVLQSAEAMKAAVAHLEPHMARASDANKGTVVLATVKGDVHDIGKNLVEIIFSNNGYRVVDLGIRVPPDELVKAAREHRPDAIGLSGLLVKSAQQMVSTAQDLRAAGVDAPLLVGGAALTNRFTGTRIAPEYGAPVLYAKDAMAGLDLLNRVLGPEREALVEAVRAEQAAMAAAPRAPPETGTFVPLARVDALPVPPGYARHVLRDIALPSAWAYLNPLMLYSKHLGLKGDPGKLVEAGDATALELRDVVEALKAEVARERLLRAEAVYRFFPANADGDRVVVWDPEAPGEKALETFTFPRMTRTPRRALADHLRPVGDGVDSVAMFVTTAGAGVRDLAERWKREGAYLKSHAVQALALETAEALAELVHKRIRTQWGIADDPTPSLRDLFKGRYRGRRYSFGYPACPDLADQAKLFALLRPEDIGVRLTEGSMMDPEASVSAIVFHHPEAEYFAV